MNETQQRPTAGGRPLLRKLGLQTHVLEQVRHFYHKILGFALVDSTAQSVAFAVGPTRLEFEQVADDSEPYYHFAFNIPENKLDEAKAWLEARVAILRHAQTGEEIIHFSGWNAHSLFFYDPAGNLVELIARHTLPNRTDEAFSVKHLLYVSEIGLVPPDQAGVFAQLRATFQLPAYLNTASFLGDEYGLIIVIPQDILWIPEYTKRGMLCPTQITMAGHGEQTLKFVDLPFTISSQAVEL